ncbi:hypothetical protein PG990_007247 [Apiospora arundinis]
MAVAAIVGAPLFVTLLSKFPSYTRQPSSVLSPMRLPRGTAQAVKTFFVDTPAGVAEAADRLWDERGLNRCIYVDLEGVELSRDGTVSLLVLYAPTEREAFVLDVFTLQSAAFATKGPRHGLSIKGILESAEHSKAFFDVRNDSDALFHHFGVALRNVEDLQLTENANRPDGSRDQLNGLSGCMLASNVLSRDERSSWKLAKKAGKSLFSPQFGGSFEVFNERPLSPEIISYCVGDVYYLPRLRERHWPRLSNAWKKKVRDASAARVLESQQKDYKSWSIDKAKSPWASEWDWIPLAEFKSPSAAVHISPLRRLE